MKSYGAGLFLDMRTHHPEGGIRVRVWETKARETATSEGIHSTTVLHQAIIWALFGLSKQNLKLILIFLIGFMCRDPGGFLAVLLMSWQLLWTSMTMRKAKSFGCHPYKTNLTMKKVGPISLRIGQGAIWKHLHRLLTSWRDKVSSNIMTRAPCYLQQGVIGGPEVA